MANFFYWVYKITSKFKYISLLFLGSIILLAILTVSRIKLEENILNIIPQDESFEDISSTIESLKLNKQLVIHVFNRKNTAVTPDTLVKIAQVFTDSLQLNAAEYIDNITIEVPDTKIELLYDFYYNNLPFYLENEDYNEIENRISEEGINTSLNKFYRSLISPMGMMTKKMMVKDPLSLTSFPLQRSKQFQIDENFNLYKNHILTNDKQHLVFFLELSNPPSETANNGKLIDELERLIPIIEESYTESKIEYFGSAAVAVSNARQIKKDINLTVGVAMICLLLFISLFYRKLISFLIVISPGVFGALIAISFLVLIRDSISIISLGVGSVLLGITIDYALHFITHFKQKKKVKKLFSDLSFPIILCSVTTASAFFSLLFIRSTALQDLGIFAGVSVLAASVFTLVVLPHLTFKESKNEQPNFVQKWIDSLANYPLHTKKWAFIIFFLFTVISLFTWTNISFESNMQKLGYMPEHLLEYENNINSISNISANNIYIASSGKSLNEALEVNIAVENELQQFINDSSIFTYLSLNSIIPAPSEQKEKLKLWEELWKKNNKDSVWINLSQKAGELGFNPSTFDGFESFLNREYSSINEDDINKVLSVFGDNLLIKKRNGETSVLTLIKLPSKNKKEVLQKLENIPDVAILDKGHLMSRMIKMLEEDFSKLVNFSLFVVFLIVLLSYGRIELALLVFAPIALSWFWVLGLMGLFGLNFNIINIIVCTFILGLGVDYSIFSMRGILQNHSLGIKTLISYKKSILLSAITTLVGIGVLALAEHPALRSIAFLAIIGILSVLFITFTVQIFLFNFLIGNRKRKGLIPYTLSSFVLSFISFFYFLLGCFLLNVLRIVFLLPIGTNDFRKESFHKVLRFYCWTILYVIGIFKKNVINKEYADYSNPSVIISNHHSFLDILILLMFHHKVVMVTNNWVYNSLFFGKTVQYADFILASAGIEQQLEKIEGLIKKGYSIAVFPEGSRSASFKLRRFHKGAFYIAEHFKLDIQPILLHGTNVNMPKGDDFYLKSNPLSIKFLPRIKYKDKSFGNSYSERTKKISKYFKKEYNDLRKETENPKYFSYILIKNYIYKGPILEWYLRVKLRLENYYQLFHEIIPNDAQILDLGCGYGFMSFSLAISSSERKITAIDYDRKKIKMAKNMPCLPPNLQFEYGDVVDFKSDPADVIIISDVLHYLLKEEQLIVLNGMLDHLKNNGKIIIRDGDSSKTKRHKGSILTEIFSTNTGFNQSRNKLNYISQDLINSFAVENNLELQIIDNTKLTSNVIFVLKRKV